MEIYDNTSTTVTRNNAANVNFYGY